MKSRNEKLFLIIIGLVFFFAGATTLSFGVRQFQQGISGKKWPTTRGVIISSGTRWQRSNSGGNPTLIADVVYEYEVNGQLFRNDRISAHQFGSSNSEHARKEANNYPEQTSVIVYFDPADPAQSLLKPGWGWIHLITLIVGSGVILAGFFLLQQGVKKDTTRGQIQARTTQTTPRRGAPLSQKKYQRPAIVLIIVAVLTGGAAIMLFRSHSEQQSIEHTTGRIADRETAEERDRMVSADEMDIVLILEQYVAAQKDYKNTNGHYTKNLQGLSLAGGFLPRVSGTHEIIIQGYMFSHVQFNGVTAMDYQHDFVIYAIPTTYQLSGRNSYAVGPKGIVISHDNHGEAVTNATELRNWRPIP